MSFPVRRRAVVQVVVALLTALVTVLVVAPGLTGPAPASADGVAADPGLVLTVSGEGVATFPAFDPAVRRYGVTTSAGTDGSVVVSASGVGTGEVVTVDGRPLVGGSRAVAGLEPGEEIPVFVDGPDGRTAYAFVYLPEEFPTLERVTPADVAPTLSHVMLTLGLFVRPSPYFETALDANGVPAVLHVNRTARSMDLKQQPNGHYSVSRGTGDPAYPNSELIELDEQFREVARYKTVGLQHTDAHDSILLPDGSRWLMAYEPGHDDATGRDVVDAVIQHVSRAGEVLFTWTSRPLLDESVMPASNPDYAHINSFQVMQDGDLLVSFRHFSSVMKIATSPRPGVPADGVVWRLGGRASDFTFEEPDRTPSEGPCAQHTASELPNGQIMVFDNGSASMFPPMVCVDPADPTGPAVQRLPTRIAAWSLEEPTDDSPGTATLVRDHQVDGRHSIFAGSAQLLPGGGEMVGWAPNYAAVATELDAAGAVRWELRDTAEQGSDRYYSYRAFALDLADATPPTVTVGIADGATFVEGQSVAPRATCRDTGGSSLQRCEVSPVDTSSVGTRRLTVTARDGAGLTTRVVRRYRVVPRYQPDAAIRAAGSRQLVGVDRLGRVPRQQLVVRTPGARAVDAVVRVRNAGRRTDRFTLVPTWRSDRFGFRVLGPTRTSGWLRPGQAWSVTVRVTPLRPARAGDELTVRLDVRSRRGARRTDAVWLVARR